MNQPYARVNQPYATLTLASALREMFGVQLYKNNARALLSRILSILNLDWLRHARSVRGVYESGLNHVSLQHTLTYVEILKKKKTERDFWLLSTVWNVSIAGNQHNLRKLGSHSSHTLVLMGGDCNVYQAIGALIALSMLGWMFTPLSTQMGQLQKIVYILAKLLYILPAPNLAHHMGFLWS